MNTPAHGPRLYFPLDLQHASIAPNRMTTGSLTVSTDGPTVKKNMEFLNGQNTTSTISRNPTLSLNIRPGFRALHRDVRPRPPWIWSSDDDDDSPTSNSTNSFSYPSNTGATTIENSTSPKNISKRLSRDGYIDFDHSDSRENQTDKRSQNGFFGGHKVRVKGRKWDHIRDGDPVIVQTRTPQSTIPWQIYIESSTFRTAVDENAVLVDGSFLDQLTPGYKVPWRGNIEDKGDPETQSGLPHSRRQQRTLMKRIQFHLLMHPLVPLFFRITVLTTSVVALAIATSVHSLSQKYDYAQTPSSTMAIVVDVIAIPYILYITWDEYTGKPLGLRAPGAKIRLVLLDLFFIVFESANLSIAFSALTDDDGGCNKSSQNGNTFNYAICSRFRALCGILMVALYAWSLTFAISIFRLVQRVGGKEGE